MIYSCFIIWALLIGSIFILILHLALSNTALLLRNGLSIFAICGILTILRLIIPLDIAPRRYSMEYPAFLSRLVNPHHLIWGRLNLIKILLLASLLVSFGIFLHFLYGVIRSKKTLYQNSLPYKEGMDMLRHIDPDCPLAVRQTPLVVFPVIVGYFQPVIYLPVQDFGEDDLRNVLDHEHTHWHCHHLHFKLFVHILTILFWWNPLIYLLEKDISHIIELICDDVVTNQYNAQEKLNYLATLIHCMKHPKKDKDHKVSPVYSLGFLRRSKGHDTIQRFEYQMNREAPTLFFYMRQAFIYLLLFLIIGSSYSFTAEPSYKPHHKPLQSNAENATLVQLKDGSYFLQFEDCMIPVNIEDVESGRYAIYNVVPYKEDH